MAYRSTATHAFTAAQFVRQFAECRSLAREEPVFISSYGRTTHALLAIAHFDALAKRTGTCVDDGSVPDLLRQWGMRAGHAVIVCNTQILVQSINPAGCTLADVKERNALGLSLERALSFPQQQHGVASVADSAGDAGGSNGLQSSPHQIESSLLVSLARRCLHLREDATAEVPSPFVPGTWLKMACFLWQEHVVITLRDITAEVRLERLADRESSLAEAMRLHSGIAALRLSVRGVIEETGDGLAKLVGLPLERLIEAQFMDIVDIPSRAEIRAAMEAVLRGGGGQSLTLRLICNAGGTVQVVASLVQLRGAYGVEGLTMVLRQDANHRLAESPHMWAG